MNSKNNPGNKKPIWNSLSERDKAYLIAQFIKESPDDLSGSQWQAFLKRHRWAKKGKQVDVVLSDEKQANDMFSSDILNPSRFRGDIYVRGESLDKKGFS